MAPYTLPACREVPVAIADQFELAVAEELVGYRKGGVPQFDPHGTYRLLHVTQFPNITTNTPQTLIRIQTTSYTTPRPDRCTDTYVISRIPP